MFEQMEQRKWAERKLRQMWQGNVVCMVSMIVMLVMVVVMLMAALSNPFTMHVGGGLEFSLLLTLISSVAMAVGGIIYLVGLYGLRNIQPEYRTAFLCWLVSVVVNLVSNQMEEGSLLYTILDLVSIVLGLVVLWLVLQATDRMMSELGREDVIRRGKMVWLLNLISTVGNLVFACLPIDTESGAQFPVFLVLTIALLIFSVVADFWYIGYLGRSADALKENLWEAGQ